MKATRYAIPSPLQRFAADLFDTMVCGQQSEFAKNRF